MVTHKKILASNAQVASMYPEGLVAVFAGATAGIGETSLRELAKCASKPRIYIIGRSKEACDRLDVDLKTVNPAGQYIFIRSDISLLRNVDEVCEEIKSKEPAINLLFMSQGTLNFTKKTDEGLLFFFGLTYFGRIRMATNLLPHIQRANGLRRVVSCFAGTKDGKVLEDDWDPITGSKESIPFSAARGHGAGMMTLALAQLARRAPDVSFVHNFPGFVNTGLIRGDEGFVFQVFKYVFKVLAVFMAIPLPEVGQRHAFFCTAARYPPSTADGKVKTAGVSLEKGFDIAKGFDGKVGSGMYNIDEKGESASPSVEDVSNVCERRHCGPFMGIH